MSRTPKPRRRATQGSVEPGSQPAALRSDGPPADPVNDTSRLLVVDRREGRMLVLVAEDGTTVEVSAARLPKDCRAEGAVLRVPIDVRGDLHWVDTVRDHAEEARRLDELSRRAERLRRSDPGGDVVL